MGTEKKVISLIVIPRSSKNEVLPLQDGSYKVRLTASPVDGEANKKLIEIISEFFGISKSCIKITKGERGRKKIIEIIYGSS